MKIMNEFFLDSNSKYKLSVIIPVFNNGVLLKNRAIKSIKKSSIFNEIEIIIIDDGSNDNLTKDIIKEIQIKYSNVKVYFFEGEASGSASRPRNKGIELSTTNYISYLDPDDEVINDSHKVLYDNIQKYSVDMVVGNIMYFIKNVKRIKDYYSRFLEVNDNCDISFDCRKIFLDMNFIAPKILSTLVKKEVITQNNICMVEGGLGQDTLFSYELMLNCKSIKVIKEPMYLYYSNVENSVTNDISVKYFEKHLITELQKRNILEKYNILDTFLNNKYDEFFILWIFIKLSKVKEEEKEKCEKVVDEIYKIYEDKWNIKSKVLNDYFIYRKLK